MFFYIFASTAASAALSGQYVGFNLIPLPKPILFPNPFDKNGTGTVAMGLSFNPETSMAHVELPVIDGFNPKKSCRKIPYTLEKGIIKLSPSAKCTAISGKPPSIQWARSLEGAKLKTWLDLDFTYDGKRDEITMDIPKGFAGWPDLKTDLIWTFARAPFRELEGAVFKADNAVDGSKINWTIKFNTDGTLNFTIPQIPMSCKKNPYLAGADGGLYMAMYVDGAELGMPKYHVKHDCVGKSLFENGVHIYSFKFTKGFEKIVVEGVVYPTSSSSSSSSESSDPPLPQGSVLCSGQRESEYCDCSFDCTHNKDFCSCEAAEKCCSSRTSELEADAPSTSSESSSDSAEEFVLVLNRVAHAPKTTFENFWANVLK